MWQLLSSNLQCLVLSVDIHYTLYVIHYFLRIAQCLTFKAHNKSHFKPGNILKLRSLGGLSSLN
jgi:hypothetical protein